MHNSQHSDVLINNKMCLILYIHICAYIWKRKCGTQKKFYYINVYASQLDDKAKTDSRSDHRENPAEGTAVQLLTLPNMPVLKRFLHCLSGNQLHGAFPYTKYHKALASVFQQ